MKYWFALYCASIHGPGSENMQTSESLTWRRGKEKSAPAPKGSLCASWAHHDRIELREVEGQ